ncbi:MAG: 2-oxo acid dehydrogenase subunit E2 [bacterium]
MNVRPPEPEYILKPLASVRKAIAQRVADCFRHVPQFDLHVEIDASLMVEARQYYKSKIDDITPGYNDMLILSCARILESHQGLNAHFTDQGVKEFKETNIGFAVATPIGVLMPVIRNVGSKSILDIAAEAKDLGAAAKQIKLRASLQMHGTFSISSLGGFGIDAFNAIICAPQVAILAAGAVKQRPFNKQGQILSVPTLNLTLTVDHRAVDGADAAAFLSDLKTELENFKYD